MLSKKDIICPENLLKIAKTKGPAKAVIVNAVKLCFNRVCKTSCRCKFNHSSFYWRQINYREKC